mmetsp:Transcript_111920/g.357234  ORF Transcript_111920/g.357234 Transcript_111920/m.357234 type:complete len:210 (-) Transcript_111920:613-1242(-)
MQTLAPLQPLGRGAIGASLPCYEGLVLGLALLAAEEAGHHTELERLEWDQVEGEDALPSRQRQVREAAGCEDVADLCVRQRAPLRVDVLQNGLQDLVLVLRRQLVVVQQLHDRGVLRNGGQLRGVHQSKVLHHGAHAGRATLRMVQLHRLPKQKDCVLGMHVLHVRDEFLEDCLQVTVVILRHVLRDSPDVVCHAVAHALGYSPQLRMP